MNAQPRIDYSKRFDKQLSKAPTNIKKAFRQRLSLFLENKHHPQLHNHTLKGRYEGMRSINVTGDWRAIYIEKFVPHDQRVIIFHVLGTHSQLYKP